MHTLKYIVLAILVISLSSCDDGKTDKPVASHDIYWCSSTYTNGSFESAFYGARRGSYNLPTTILTHKGSMDSCIVDQLGNIYWGDRVAGAIFKATKYGTNVQEIVSNLDIPFGLSIDNKNNRLYWSNWLQASFPQSGEVGYSNLDGSGQNIIVTTGLSSGGHILVDTINDEVYISDLFGGKIVKTGLEGGALSVITTANQPAQFDIDHTHGLLIWADIANDSISSVNLDGSNSQEIIAFNDLFANPNALSIDQTNQKLYFVSKGFTTQAANGSEALESSNLDGTGISLVNAGLSLGVQSLWTVQ